mgnify:CR=1 FL=1
MVKTLTEDFDAFIDIIDQDKKIKNDIIDKHTSLTDMIKQDHPKGYNINRTRISGSYGKNTEIKEFDPNKNPDVDIVIILDTEIDDVKQINKDFYDYLIDKKASVVQEVRQQSNSIGLKYKNIDVDIVLAKDNKDGSIKITSDKKQSWIDSNCLKQIDYMTEQNKKYTTFGYKKLMKLFKYLNKEILNNKIKSYTLEMLIHQCVPSNRVDLKIWNAFSETLGNIVNLESIEDIKDCCDSAKNGYDDKDKNIFSHFKNEIFELYKKSLDAINGDRKKWEEIFGNRFPVQPEQKVKNNNQYDKKQTPWCDE